MARIGGSAFHEWSEQYDRSALALGGDEPEPVDQIFLRLVAEEEEASQVPRDQWQISGRRTKEKPNKEDFEVWRDTLLPEFCEAYIEWRRNSPWHIATGLPPDKNGNTVGIEYELEFYVRNTKVKGFVDRVEQDENGNIGAIDLKTWSRERTSAQIPTYLVGLQKRGVLATWGAYYHARKGVSGEQKFFTSWNEARLAAMYDSAAKVESLRIYIPKPSDDCKSFCSVAAHCEYAL